jgi:hypothetical protein
MKSPFLLSDVPEAARAAAAPPGAPGAGAPSGLVKLKTSHTLKPNTVEIDKEKARLTRMRRSLTWAATLIQDALGPLRYRPAMLTLTYRDVEGFKACHVSELLKRIRGWLERRGRQLHYVWVAELQKRGALHYHIVIWLPKGLTLPKPDKQGWWPHGSTRIEWARNPIGYLIKYTTKFDTKHGLPKGARLHGAGGFTATGKQIRRWINLPTWLKRLAGVGSAFVRIKGSGLVERDTGVCMQSPWRVSCSGGRVTATQVFEYVGGLKFVCGPYSMLGGGIAW